MSLSKLRCQKQRIIFQFLEDTTGGKFSPTTSWGFEIKRPTEDHKEARWAEVKLVGKDVKHVVPGDFVFIEPLMWTLNFQYEGQKYWATDEVKVLGVSKTRPSGLM